jgi:hypothetical protein
MRRSKSLRNPTPTSATPARAACATFAACFALLLTAAPSAVAQDDSKNGDDAPKVKVERGKGGKKIYRIEEEIRIEGKIQKPEAFYVLQKSSINYEWQKMKQAFLPKITESVKKAPF